MKLVSDEDLDKDGPITRLRKEYDELLEERANLIQRMEEAEDLLRSAHNASVSAIRRKANAILRRVDRSVERLNLSAEQENARNQTLRDAIEVLVDEQTALDRRIRSNLYEIEKRKVEMEEIFFNRRVKGLKRKMNI